MKRTIFIILSVFITVLSAYSQDATSLPVDNPVAFDYKNTSEWSTYKTLRAVGWSSLGVGVPMTLTGLLGIALSSINGGNGGPFIIVTAVGGGLTVASVPLLITAYHYRHKAKKMALNVGVTSINTPVTNRPDYTPALSLALTF